MLRRSVNRIVSVCLCALLLGAASRGVAQVTVISPLPNGIAQVHDSVAHVRVRISLGPQIRALKVALVPDTQSVLPSNYVRVNDTRLYDSLFIIPRDRIGYSLYWDADSLGIDLRGSVTGVVPGHIFGIAGQSNATGWTWEMGEQPVGDIRMLRYKPYWQPASEPTAYAGGGPWIVMANRIWTALDDSLPIGIVNRAIGGSGLLFDGGFGMWKRNDADPEDSNTIYGKALRAFRAAGSEFEDICWIQGEAEGCCYPPVTVAGYRAAFGNLVQNFSSDLGAAVRVLHLQVSGQDLSDAHQTMFATVREALRALPYSTYVGTGVGRGLRDGLHYTVPSLHSVGKIFADAYLLGAFHRVTSMYPPVDPDTVITLDSVSDPVITGGRCITVHWRKGEVHPALHAVTSSQYFALESQDRSYDTSQVSYRIDPADPSSVQVWLRSGVLDLSLRWWITYIPTPGAQDAPLATMIGNDTIFATAFYQLPVIQGPKDGVPFLSTITDRIRVSGARLYFLPFEGEATGVLRVYNVAGQLITDRRFNASAGDESIDVTGRNLLPGVYFVQLLAGARTLATHVLVQ